MTGQVVRRARSVSLLAVIAQMRNSRHHLNVTLQLPNTNRNIQKGLNLRLPGDLTKDNVCAFSNDMLRISYGM
jgi:hypothetical protein